VYRLDPDRSLHTVLTDVTISNGVDWAHAAFPKASRRPNCGANQAPAASSACAQGTGAGQEGSSGSR